MDVTSLVAFLVPNAQQWIADQRNIHRAKSSALAKETIETLHRHFREATLGRAQIRNVSQIKLYALDASLALKPGAKKVQVEEAMKGHVLAQTELIGLYRRK